MHFTQTQRKAILFLVTIFTLVIAYHFINQIIYQPEPFDFSAFDEKFYAKRDSIAKLLDEGKIYDASQGSEDYSQLESSPATNTTVNINSASIDELTTLPRIGPVIAQRIIDYRSQNGGFASKEDLKKVRGIGKKTYENLKDLISVD